MQAWIEARKRHGLSHGQVPMARELGMNPEKLGKLDRQEKLLRRQTETVELEEPDVPHS